MGMAKGVAGEPDHALTWCGRVSRLPRSPLSAPRGHVCVSCLLACLAWLGDPTPSGLACGFAGCALRHRDITLKSDVPVKT
jgi:hypothetical protein